MSRIWEKIEAKYAKTLAKVQVAAVFFFKHDMQRNFFPQIYRDLYGDAILVPIWMRVNMAAGNQQKHVTEFCYKPVNLSLDGLKNIKVLILLIHELFR